MNVTRTERQNVGALCVYGVLITAFVVTYLPAIQQLVGAWYRSDDYSHGFAILPVSLYVVWLRRKTLSKTPVGPGRYGSVLLALSILCYIVAFMAKILTLSSLALVFTLWSGVWFLFGSRVFRILLFPQLLLLLMIPAPAQFYSMATIPLQLLVSKTSAVIAGWSNVTILREGNVLHLPDHTLAVVQACSGLRSLMSLLTLTAIFGYLTLRSNLLRGLLMVSALPAAILVNIVRVVFMILALYYFDVNLSDGPLHSAFGMIIFCLALLLVALTRHWLARWDLK